MTNATRHTRFDYAAAAERLKGVVRKTPLQYNQRLSQQYGCDIYLKREDLQVVRSYKLRGAYNLMKSLSNEELSRGVVCASAGNHAQGFAFSCKKLKCRGVVFMPAITPQQKITQTKLFGEEYIEVRLTGDSYDDCAAAAHAYAQTNNLVFVHPFDDPRIIEGQATVALEILEEQSHVDVLLVPVGGGGLSAGTGSYFKTFSPQTTIVGVEPEGAPSMKAALAAGHPVALNTIETFVDGAAVKRGGDITFSICRDVLDEMVTVAEGKICTSILELYNRDAIVVEPAGALSIAALDTCRQQIKGKTVVCVVSGSNNDIERMQEIKERSLQHEGLKHYFLIRFAQRPGALKDFVNQVLGPHDDITRFEFIKKTQRERGPALVGIELQDAADYTALIDRMRKHRFGFKEVNSDPALFEYLI